ncbi:MAG: IS21 family transposase [Anaerolineae bacterium]
MDIRDILYRIRAQESDRAIQRATGVDPRTVKKYREWAAAQGLLEGPLPPLVELERRLAQTMATPPPPQNVSSVEPYRALVVQLRQAGVEIAAIHQRLQERGYSGSYMAVWRFVRKLEPRTPEATVRVERAPGEEAQVDFGAAGKMLDPETGKARQAWAFVMTLSWSRHQFVHFVFDQKLTTWLDCHRRAFACFGGVPKRIVVDNLKAAITKACWDDPEVQQSYRECAEHYGFLIGPCRPNTPEHKGKVEQGGVHYVKRNFLGGRELTTITQANQEVRQWCETTAGERLHGTTKEKPRVRFQAVERDRLQPLPATPYDLGVWKLLKLHRDCYVTFDGACYSAPFAYIGQRLRVRAGTRQVRIYTMDFQLIATHERAERPGTRRTNLDHLPPQKVPGLTLERDACRAEAAQLGPATVAVVGSLLDDPVIDRLPTVGRLLRLRQRFGDDRLEAACRRALHFEDPAYPTVKRILTAGLEAAPLPDQPVPAPPAQTFVRSAVELVGERLGGLAWT